MNYALQIKTKEEARIEARKEVITETIAWLILIPVTLMAGLGVFAITVAILIN
tara:strand:+ start:95 stop:253 length:159 start_codon:yes stop_codon:yes gene_type:complete